MTQNLVFIAMYRALDCLYDETKREDLRDYLSDANPYLFADRKSADPAVYAEFCNYLSENSPKNDYSPEESYSLVRQYLSSECLSYYGNFISAFDDISMEEWLNLCNIIENEEI